MKNSLFTLILAISFMAGSLYAARQSSFQKEATTLAELSAPAPDYASALTNAGAPKYQNAETEEWKAFRTAAEAKIRSNEMFIAELSVKINKPGTALDTLCVERISTLTRQNQAFIARLETFEKSRSNWETFKRDLNHDMDELEKALKKLAATTKN